MFQGRTLLIATKHKKEQVIAPLFEKAFGVKCVIPKAFDTDQFGTFSSEINRKLDPINTLKNKALAGSNLESCDLVVANEGSFGPHPHSCFLPADDELIIFIDRKNGLEIIARELSTDTNFHAATIVNEIALNEFLKTIDFPNHGVILKKNATSTENMIKGLNDYISLLDHFRSIIELNGSAYIETDMRAMFNPTRMKVIEKATKKLIDKINSLCPNCNAPGFDVTRVIKGLACAVCSLPTNSTFSFEYECARCAYMHEKMFPHSKKTEDPTYCDFCNP